MVCSFEDASILHGNKSEMRVPEGPVNDLLFLQVSAQLGLASGFYKALVLALDPKHFQTSKDGFVLLTFCRAVSETRLSSSGTSAR